MKGLVTKEPRRCGSEKRNFGINRVDNLQIIIAWRFRFGRERTTKANEK